ncbi:hypothetical protein C8Q79DRAFT_247500 [Trametes meyenii]|nr:hypothetical protein C8Q79DRAFT_247500 [Trametes meyenii]
MKSEFSTSWIPIQKNSSSTPVRHQTELHQSNSHQLPPSSPLLTPRTAAPANRAQSFAASFRSVFHRSPQRATSASSLHSAYSGNSSNKAPSYSTADSASLHPYAAMVAAPLPVVSSHDASDEEEECPVCLEPLSSSFRLPGEKPHIVPECGHALHEVSFTSLRALRLRTPSPPPPPRGGSRCRAPYAVQSSNMWRQRTIPTYCASPHVVPGVPRAVQAVQALEWCLRLLRCVPLSGCRVVRRLRASLPAFLSRK